jgi:hypothetical protein
MNLEQRDAELARTIEEKKVLKVQIQTQQEAFKSGLKLLF